MTDEQFKELTKLIAAMNNSMVNACYIITLLLAAILFLILFL